MSYSLILLQVPPGTPEEAIEKIAESLNQAEIDRPPGPPDPEAQRRKRALTDALLAEYPELEGGEPDYARLAKALRMTEDQARKEHHDWELDGPMDGARIQITLYDTWIHISMQSTGLDGDWEELWGYLEVLVREGGFVVFDPQGPSVLDLAAGPHGDGRRSKTTKRRKPRRTKRRDEEADGDDEDDETEPQNARGPVSRIGALIDRIADDALGASLTAAGYVKDDARTWRRYGADGAIQVVQINGPRRNEGKEAGFGLNVGSYFPTLAKQDGYFPVTDKPNEWDCHARKFGSPSWTVRLPEEESAKPRQESGGLLGDLFGWLGPRRERNRRQRTLEQHARATRELREELDQRALPWLARMSTLRGVRDDEARQRRFLDAARMSLALGDRDEAARFVDRGLAQALAERRPHDREKILNWAGEHGLVNSRG